MMNGSSHLSVTGKRHEYQTKGDVYIMSKLINRIREELVRNGHVVTAGLSNGRYICRLIHTQTNKVVGVGSKTHLTDAIAQAISKALIKEEYHELMSQYTGTTVDTRRFVS